MLVGMLARVALGLSLLTSGVASRQMMTKDELHARQRAAVDRLRNRPTFDRLPILDKRAQVKNITFSNPRASEFWVDGTAIPEVDFDVGPSWSGLLPISSDPDETRKLFFWFFPPGPQGSLDDIIFWTNGGPGCSSLEGFFQENGPFTWGVGQAKPTVNEHSWTNLSSVLWVEQPVGTGFSQGTPNIRNEDDLAEQLVGFFNQFLEVFSELKGKKLYLSGESYAEMYVPYIANWIYEHPDELPDWDLQGIWIADPVLGSDGLQDLVPAVNFVHKYENVFAFNQTFLAELDALADSCGFTEYLDKFTAAPPAGPLPSPNISRACDTWDLIFDAALAVNPAFNIYRIFDTFPVLWDVLGFPGSFEQVQVSPIYFDREDVKRAIHAPVNVTWTECSNVRVFPRGDASDPPAWTVLPNVIEKSQRTVVVHGLADFILIAEGYSATGNSKYDMQVSDFRWLLPSRFTIFLGGGTQGFQTPIEKDSFIVEGMGALGNAHTERNFTFVEVALSGHMVPQFSPVAAFQIMEYLMGFRDSVSV